MAYALTTLAFVRGDDGLLAPAKLLSTAMGSIEVPALSNLLHTYPKQTLEVIQEQASRSVVRRLPSTTFSRRCLDAVCRNSPRTLLPSSLRRREARS
jgi:hypothetical protein